MNEHLARLVLEVASWIELSPDTVVEPKAAVAWLETIASELAEMSEANRRELVAVARALADEARAAGRVEEASFYEEAPEAMGFAV
jgi:hypothetical protein